jgi:hypothetical protein
MLHRAWTAFVAGIAGASVGIVAVILLMQAGFRMESARHAVWILAIVGFVLGLIFAGKR